MAANSPPQLALPVTDDDDDEDDGLTLGLLIDNHASPPPLLPQGNLPGPNESKKVL
jgi:hypothetical protein